MIEKNPNLLLVSFCNVMPRGLVLGFYDYDTEEFSWITLGKDNDFLHGCTGIAFKNNKLWILSQIGKKSGLILLNQNYDFERQFILEQTKDAHELIPYQDGFLVTDTGHNKINKIIFKNNHISETTFWKYNDDDSDTVHINSISQIHEKIFVSLFGQKSDNKWLDARNGKIIEITNNETISENLFHPHSLININDVLYCLESNAGNIYRFNDKYEPEKILSLPGYIRGITFDENFFYVGVSARRRKSRSKGTINTPFSKNLEDAYSWIYRINQNTLQIEKRNMMYFGTEIFDLLLIKNTKLDATKNPIIQRLTKFEDELFEYDAKLADSNAKLADSNAKLADSNAKLDYYQKEINDIKQSKIWRILKKWDRFRGKIN